MRGTIILLALLALVVCVGLAGAQEQKEEGVLGKVKSIFPGSGEKACAPKVGEEKVATPKEAAGIMEKVKGALPGAEEKAAPPKEGEGIMEKMKELVPAKSAK